LESKKFWSQLSYFGFSFLPLFYFLFTTAFSQKYHIITPRNLAALSVIPFVTIPLALTNDFHLFQNPIILLFPTNCRESPFFVFAFANGMIWKQESFRKNARYGRAIFDKLSHSQFEIYAEIWNRRFLSDHQDLHQWPGLI
jgi:hypothetical protein